MREAEIVRKIKTDLRNKYNIICVKYHGSAFGEAGVADLLCAVPMKNGQAAFAAFEIKAGDKAKATKLQEVWLANMRSTGAAAGVAHNTEEAEMILSRKGLI